MAALTVTPITVAGITPTLVAVSNTAQTVPVGNTTFIAVTNASGASVTVTVTSSVTVGSLAVADPTVTVAAGTTKWIGPFPSNIYNNGSGQVALAYSALTSVTVGAFSI